jgi:hypothetical protein
MDPAALQRKALETMEQAGRGTGAEGRIPSDPAEPDIVRFQKAMHQAEGGDDAVPQPPAADAYPDSRPRGVGDRILDDMRSASESIRAARMEAADILMKEDVTQADLLRANFSMLESSALASGIAKTTEKITQGLKTLQQG